LLTGRLPHGDTTTPGAELARRIVHTEPPRPSQAVTEGSGARLAETRRHGDRLTPQRLARELAGDLDNIVLMALRKEPERRYPSALALAEDIDRHLAHLPVRARPDTVAYRTAKFVRGSGVHMAARRGARSGSRGRGPRTQCRPVQCLGAPAHQRRRGRHA
jgi:eukaryotic-like serine/threonine-protein kinase